MSSQNSLDSQLEKWGGYLILNLIIENNHEFEPLLSGDDKYLEPIILKLVQKNYIHAGVTGYQATITGRQAYEEWMKQLYECNHRLEVFCAVDLSAGEFAYAKYYDFHSDEEWKAYLDQSRFVDIRLTVAKEYQVDPGEFVFVSFLNEGRWHNLNENSGWQFDLVAGKLLEEIHTIVSDAIRVSDLGYTHEGKSISGEAVLDDIINQGEELMVELAKIETKKKPQRNSSVNEKDNTTKYTKHIKGYETEEGLDDAYKL